MAWALTNGDDDPDQAAAGDRPAATASADQSSGEPEPSDTAEPDPEPAEPETTPAEPDPTESSPPVDEGESPGDFVTDYYLLLPGDTEAAWTRFTEAYQAELGGYEKYDGFWRTIDAVSVEGIEVNELVVDVTLAYTTDGSTQTETRRIYLEATDDDYLITRDELV